MEWFSRKTSIAGIQVSNWILVIVGAVVIWINTHLSHTEAHWPIPIGTSRRKNSNL